MRRLVVLALVIILLGQLCSFVAPFGSVKADVFRGNVRVDSNRGPGAIRSSPSMVADNGNIYIVWHDTRNSGSDVYYTKSSNQGVSFLLDVRVNDNPLDGTYQQLPDVGFGNGNVYVVWDDGRAGLGIHEIYFARSTNGFTFGPSIKISGSGTSESNPSIAVDQNTGIIYVAWASNKETIKLARSLDYGESFEPFIFVSDLTLYDRDHPDVAVDSAGKVFVAWSDMRLGIPPFWGLYYDVFIANSTDNGQTFGANTPVNEVDTRALQFRPSLAIDGNDVLHISWEDERNGNMDIYYASSSDGYNFGENVIVNDPYSHPRNPSITHQTSSLDVHESGNPIYVTWTDDRVGNHSVYLAKSTNGGNSFHTAANYFGGNYFFDGNYTLNGGRNSNEAVVLDNDNGILDPGVLDGLDSPDKIVVPGQANLQEDLNGHELRYCDINGNQVWDEDEDIVVDAGLNAGVILYPRVRATRINPQDTTVGNFISFLRWDLRNNDAKYYEVQKDERMVVGWFEIGNAEDETMNPELTGLKPGDPISGVEIHFAYKTHPGYDGSNSMTWSQALAVENPFFQIVDTSGLEIYESVDLYSLGVNTVEILQQLNISFANDATSALNVSFNSMSLKIKRGLPDGYDIYDHVIYDGISEPPMGMPLTNLTDEDNVMFVDGSGNGFYDRGEPLLVTDGDVDPGGIINETFEVLARGDGPNWDAVMDPFPLNDDLDNSWQDHPVVAIDSVGEAYVVWRDRRHWPLSDAIYFTTTALDTIPPQVLQCIPSNGATEVPLDAVITFIFSEPMQSDTTSYVDFSPETVGLWEWNWDKTNLTFIPSEPLQDNTTYSYLISSGKDRSGNLIEVPKSCSFRTVEGPAISHARPLHSYAGEPIDITATISDNDSVVDATIFYVNIGETFFSQAEINRSSGSSTSGVWEGQIPAQPLMGFLSYHIIATDGVGNTGRSPRSGEHTLIVGDGDPPTVSHVVIKTATAGSEVTFSATATDNINVFLVRLYVKPMGSDRYNPPIVMDCVGLTDVFETKVRIPETDGDMFYYIEAVDEWGNVATSGNATNPHKISVTGAPLDLGAIAIWGTLFIIIALIYVGLFISIRRPSEDEESEEEMTEEEA